MALGVQIASFYYVGTAQLDEIFGGYTAPSAVQIQRIQVSSRVAATGGNVTFALVDADGGLYGAEVVLAASTKYRDAGLAAPITLVPGESVFVKITGVDLGTAQDFNVTLIGATSQGAIAPCCSSCCCC